MHLVLLNARRKADDEDHDHSIRDQRITGVKAVHLTYKSHVFVHFKTEKDAARARKATNWERWDETVLRITYADDLIRGLDYKGYIFFSDWELVEENAEAEAED